MLQSNVVAVVMPAYNVEDRIAAAVLSVPAYVDLLIVVEDGSSDATWQVLGSLARPGLVLLQHAQNRGVGAAISSGYAEALKRGAAVVAVMAGDGQMDPTDLRRVLSPVVQGQADYVKGNRFRCREVWRVMPADRLVGNIVLSLLTKLTSGYWRLFDSQCGYTAISSTALHAIEGQLYSRYGYPNDVLARLRTAGARVAEVPVKPIYEGQASGIRLRTVFYPILFVLLRSLGRRLWQQHGRRALGLAPPPPQELLGADRAAEHFLPAPPP